jgi:uncharacterized protein DUF87
LKFVEFSDERLCAFPVDSDADEFLVLPDSPELFVSRPGKHASFPFKVWCLDGGNAVASRKDDYAKSAASVTMERRDILFIGRTTWRDPRVFGIPTEDRRSHVYIVGKTGTGKSTLMEFMLRQDIACGRGVALLDPHGDLVTRIEKWIPQNRREDVVYLDVPNPSGPESLNPLESVPVLQRSVVAAGLVATLT